MSMWEYVLAFGNRMIDLISGVEGWRNSGSLVDIFEGLTYDDVALVTLDIVESPKRGAPNRITFKEDSVIDQINIGTATFVRNIKRIRDRSRGPRSYMYEAEKLTPNSVRRIINQNEKTQILLSMHGFMSTPTTHLRKCHKARNKFSKFELIPVLWSSESYRQTPLIWKDNKRAPYLKLTMETIEDVTRSFKKSLLVASTGCRVLRQIATHSFNFEHIFMVAPGKVYDAAALIFYLCLILHAQYRFSFLHY